MKNSRRGYTLIELMIVVAIIGILAAAAVATYQTYTIRSQVAEGLNLSGPLKNAVTSFYVDRGVFPVDNAEAGVETEDGYSGKYVTSIAVNGAVISIEYGGDAHTYIAGESVTLTAIGSLGSVSWTCQSGGVIPDILLPPVCR